MKKITSIIIAIFYTQSAYAQELIPCPDGTFAEPEIGCVIAPSSIVNPESDILSLILNFASSLMMIVAGIAILSLIYGGIRYALALGNDEQIHRAKRIIIWSTIGLIISLLAQYIAAFVVKTI